MRIIDLDDAHHQGHSCASSEQIMRINGNDDAGDVNSGGGTGSITPGGGGGNGGQNGDMN
jgi:hypothetical protein